MRESGKLGDSVKVDPFYINPIALAIIRDSIEERVMQFGAKKLGTANCVQDYLYGGAENKKGSIVLNIKNLKILFDT